MNNTLFAQIIDSLSDALITVDQDKRIVNWNRQAEAIFGYTKEEISLKGLEAIIPPQYRQRHRESYDRFVKSIHERSSYVSEVREVEGLRKDGEVFPIELTHSLLKISDERFYISAIIRDVSLRKDYELMRTRLERITRHDLKNKLVIVALSADKLSKALEGLESAKVRKYLEIVQSESKECLGLLDSTRELLLLETGEYQLDDSPLDLLDVIAVKKRQLEPLASEKDVEIDFRNSTGWQGVELRGDRTLLERALENLIKNAIEAEEVGGTVRMTLLKEEGRTPVLEIKNGGEPIPEDVKDTLFKPYVTHGKEKGEGLGLYAAKLIVEKAHPWKLTFESGPEGTVFRVVFRTSISKDEA